MEGHKSTIKAPSYRPENSLDKMLMLKFSEC